MPRKVHDLPDSTKNPPPVETETQKLFPMFEDHMPESPLQGPELSPPAQNVLSDDSFAIA